MFGSATGQVHSTEIPKGKTTLLFSVPAMTRLDATLKLRRQHITFDVLNEDSTRAAYMPALDADIKCIVAVRFNKHFFVRLGTLQAEARWLQ